MSAVSVARVRDSPFKESEWDRRLDDMLEDLGTGGAEAGGQAAVTRTQQFSSSSSSQQTSYSSQQGTRTQSVSQSSQAAQRSVSGGGSNQPQRPGGNFALTRGPSGADLADGVLRDLEDGLVKSTSYIQEQHRAQSGPEGSQEWHEVRRGGDPGGFNLEQQVQHMIPASLQQRQQSSSVQQQRSVSSQQYTSQQQLQQQQQQQQQYNQVYKVQSNQYSGAGERIVSPVQGEEEERPSSRLKQNIDELDTLLYDLNNARNLSPEVQGPDYGTSPTSHSTLLDSDDYDETVGTTGHVKRTVTAFNDYTGQPGKPPSPSPRRKPSPQMVRKTPPTSPTRMHQNMASSSSYNQQQQQTSSSSYYRQEEQQPSYPPVSPSSPYQGGAPGSYQPFSYTDSPDPPHHAPGPRPDPAPQQAFPSASARPPTPQMPPKRVEELMSEFHEFDSVHGGSVSPVPAPFCAPPPRQHGHVTVTELEDEPSRPQVAQPRKPAPNTPGPEVYYPPGADYHRAPPAVVAEQEVRPVADGGSLALERKGRREKERGRRDREEGGDKQGAAVIPICLPLCCAAPCVIM